jgi:DNA-binding MurR/RpiR family transcriptional regulator
MDILGITEIIEDKYDSLSPQLKKLARIVLQDPAKIAFNSLRKVAAEAEVGPTTLVRFTTTLGFASYDDFREMFRQNLMRGSERYSGAATKLVAAGQNQGQEPLFHKTGQTLSSQIEHVFKSLTFDDVMGAARELSNAPAVHVLGLRSCYPAAFYFYYTVGTFRKNVHLINGAHGMLADDLLRIAKNDVLLAFSYTPYPQETVDAVSFGAAKKARIIALTDSKLSPIARAARCAFVLPPSLSAFYTSLTPTIALLEALISLMVTHSKEDAIEQIRSRFTRLEEIGIYWTERKRKKGDPR